MNFLDKFPDGLGKAFRLIAAIAAGIVAAALLAIAVWCGWYFNGH